MYSQTNRKLHKRRTDGRHDGRTDRQTSRKTTIGSFFEKEIPKTNACEAYEYFLLCKNVH